MPKLFHPALLVQKTSRLVAGSLAGLTPGKTDPNPASIGDRMVRFRDPRVTGEPEPNPAFARPIDPKLPAPGTRSTPRFRRLGNKASVIELGFEDGLSCYGTGEAAGSLLRNGSHTTCWNNDAFGYSERTGNLYQSHPWVLGVRRDGTAFGVLCETTRRCDIDLRVGIRFVVHGPSCPAIVIERDSPHEVVEALAELTGTMPMPPRWALGYQQCRWSYHPDERAKEVAQEFRDREIPCDVIWLDIDYMDGFRCFTFDDEQFPDPREFNTELHGMGFRTVWMIDPGIKADPHDPHYQIYTEGRDGDHFVKAAGGKDYVGDVWPGACSFPDFTRAETREWWAGLYGEFMATGIDGVWNDMNEPAVFGGPEKTMPITNVHRADNELGGLGTHARYHNVYGMLMTRATREGIARANPGKRPFVLTRANYIGGQRYAACWTGDNLSTWEHLGWSIPMALNLGLSGQPFAGPDIGGFGRRATPKLFARWMGIGTLLPFARAHTNKYLDPNADGGATGGDQIMPDHEPWSFGDECERVCRLAINRRYRLLPYLYTLFREAHVRGLPVVRPVFFADPADPKLRNIDDAFLLGDDVLVRASNARDGSRSTAFPCGGWARFEPAGDDERADTERELPELFVREGAIVPLGPIMQFSDEKPVDPLTLVVHLDADGEASGELYEDIGDGFGFETGEYRLVRYSAHRDGDRFVITAERIDGDWDFADRRLRVVVLGESIVEGSGKDGAELVL